MSDPTVAAAPELVLAMVVRIEKIDPPTRTSALEAAARAVLIMLTSQRPEWSARIDEWDAQRIRKVVRRARGAEWRRARAVDGLDVSHRGAELRVYPPIPLDGWPPELAKLQVGGTDLTDAQRPKPPLPDQPLILLSPHVQMTAGKSMAQAGHAAQLGWRASGPTDREHWKSDGFALAVRLATPDLWASAVEAGAPVVRDGGFTEVEPDSETALVVLPWQSQ
ncbi:MAG: peptidyl-tRNA hydrolase [Actinomycetota bacterium]|nr:peptidyl-tRNA hydrolase [Actinomycetota bacterium]